MSSLRERIERANPIPRLRPETFDEQIVRLLEEIVREERERRHLELERLHREAARWGERPLSEILF